MLCAQLCILALLQGEPEHHLALTLAQLNDLPLPAPLSRSKLMQIGIEALELHLGLFLHSG